MSQLRNYKEEEVGLLCRRYETVSKAIFVAWDCVRIVRMPLLNDFVDRRHWTPLYHSEWLEVELIVQGESGKHLRLDRLLSEKKMAKAVENMCENFAFWLPLNQCLSNTCSTRKQAAPDIFFKLLRHSTMLSQLSWIRAVWERKKKDAAIYKGSMKIRTRCCCEWQWNTK